MVNKIGQKIAQARVAAGASAGSVARAAGLDASLYSRIESGAVSKPSFDAVARIAKALDLDLNTFIGSEYAGACLSATVELLRLRTQLQKALKAVEVVIDKA